MAFTRDEILSDFTIRLTLVSRLLERGQERESRQSLLRRGVRTSLLSIIR